ncbi:chromosome partitioning protein [Arboricoccus pini]|uniref:Chromosome partitioning protein n=1 Tax=Arboricoccus pini TaxID=1963835 RepID=A0A212R3N1_9PROT|nr:ParA family protein [Arboricoccus pini]SNB66536.1 chromosome partitioning protein [Arboricoccus pini]
MSVLTIASSKGGPGKTTVTMLLAAALAKEGQRLSVIDADPTEAFSRWARQTYEGPPFDCFFEAEESRLAHRINERAGLDELVLVDTAGFGNRAAAVAMTSADLVIIPTLSGEADVTEAEKTMRLVQGLAAAARRDIQARVLLNKMRRTHLARHAASEIEKAGLKRLKTSLSDLVAYGELSYSGILPSSRPAVTELGDLLAELRKEGWLGPPPGKKHRRAKRTIAS